MTPRSSAPSRLRMVRLQAVRLESETVKVLTFRDELCAEAKPGQFVMVWSPGAEEIPMSLTLMNRKMRTASIAVKIVGETTRAIHQLKEGEVMGVRGPYGNGFTLEWGAALLVGGGVGLSPLLPLAEKLAERDTAVTVVAGAKTKSELLFLRRFRRVGEVVATTEDGTYGLKGCATHALEALLKRRRRFKTVYTCGPEPLLKAVMETATRYKIPVQVSLERYMKCGIGICGSCVIGKYRVCRDGPVFSDKTLTRIGEFGLWKRDAAGRAIPV